MANGANVRARWVTATASTSSSTLDLTSAGAGTCQAAIVFASYTFTDGAGGSAAPGIFSAGFLRISGTTSATEHCIANGAEDQVSTENTSNRGNTAASVLLFNWSGGSVFLSDYALFDTRITDGIRLEANGGSNWGAAYKFRALLLYGDDSEISAEVGQYLSHGTQDNAVTVTLGTSFDEEPELVFLCSADHSLDNTNVSNYVFSFGAAHSTGGGTPTITQWGANYFIEDAASSRAGDIIIYDTRVQPFAWDSGLAKSNIELTDTGTESFDLTTRETSGAHRGMYLALSFKGSLSTYAGYWTYPTTAASGTISNTAPGFKPQAYMLFESNSNDSTKGTIVSGNLAHSFALGGSDQAGSRGSIGNRFRNTTPFDTRSYGNSTVIDVRAHNGGTSAGATHTSFDASGFTVTVTTSVANAKAFAVVAFEEAPTQVSGTAAGSASTSAHLTGISPASGTTAGSASTTAHLVGDGALAGSADGVATESALLQGAGAMAGSSNGAASTTAHLYGQLPASGTAAGSTTSTANLQGLRFGSGTAAGSATTSANLVGRGLVVGTSAGVASEAAHLQGTGALVGTSAGVASEAADLVGLGAMSATANGVASESAVLRGAGPLAGTSSGVASEAADLTGRGAMAATAAGTATTSAHLCGILPASGTAAGVATTSGDLSGLGEGSMTGTSAGAATTSALLVGAGAAAATADGAATTAAHLCGLLPASGSTAGAATTVAHLCGILPASGTAGGAATTSAVLSVVAGGLSGTAAGLAAVSAHLAAVGYMAATAAGAADVVGHLRAIGLDGCYETVARLVRTRVGSLVEDAESIAFVYENTDGAPPADEFVRLWVEWTSVRQATYGVGQRTHRKEGRAVAEVHVRAGTGDGRAWEIADLVGDALRRYQSGEVLFRDPGSPVAPRRDGEHYVVRVSVPFYLHVGEDA